MEPAFFITHPDDLARRYSARRVKGSGAVVDPVAVGTEETVAVRWRVARWFNATLFGLLSLVFLAQLVQPDSLAGHLFTLALFSFPATICVRALRAEVRANGNGVVARGTFRTRRFSRDEVDAFLTVPRRRNWFGRVGKTLAIRLRDGRTLRLLDWFTPGPRWEWAAFDVEAAADRLNAALTS